MIARIWHGWTAPADADAYEELLRSEIRELLSRFDASSAHYEVLLQPTDLARDER